MEIFIFLKNHHAVTKLDTHLARTGHIYITQGTAMGTRMAPNYAIIFMHSVEQEILNNSKLKPRIWHCFIDDMDLWKGEIRRLPKLH